VSISPLRFVYLTPACGEMYMYNTIWHNKVCQLIIKFNGFAYVHGHIFWFPSPIIMTATIHCLKWWSTPKINYWSVVHKKCRSSRSRYKLIKHKTIINDLLHSRLSTPLTGMWFLFFLEFIKNVCSQICCLSWCDLWNCRPSLFNFYLCIFINLNVFM
jgi:hypothetical protein